jgi:hypothetical protein
MIFNHLRRMAKQVVERLLIIAAFPCSSPRVTPP